MLTIIDFYISIFYPHTWYQRPSLNFLARCSMKTLGKSNENNDWQVFTILISQVLKSFIKKLVCYKSEFRSFLVNGQTSKQYIYSSLFVKKNDSIGKIQKNVTKLQKKQYGTGLCSSCSYRIRGVEGSCAKHITTEFYFIRSLCCSHLFLLLLVFHHPINFSFQA